jgi:hypothetical protein
MVDITTPDLLPGLNGNIVKKRLVDMGDGTFAEMTVTTLAASANAVGTVNLGSLNGAATAANQTLGNAALSLLTAPFVAATAAPLTAAIGDTAAHVLGPLLPQLNRPIWVTLNAMVQASGTAQLLRSTDGGTTRMAITRNSVVIGSFSFNAVAGAIVNEPVQIETDASATYYLAITLTSGTVSVRVAQ